MSDPLSQLEAKYCPPIDSALFSAIVSDYDISDEASLQEVKSTLDALKASALDEEATGFDASGSGGQRGDPKDARPSASSPDTDASPPSDTNLTGLSHGVSSIGLTDGSSETSSLHGTDDVDLEVLDNETKALLLKDVFPDMSDFTITHTLKKCDYKWQRALDDLLNQSYLTEAGEADLDHQMVAKGIDAFSEENTARRGRKGKKKGKNRKSEENSRSSSTSYSPPTEYIPPNKWLTAPEEIDFIASRTKIDASLVRSAYNKNGTSMPDTITYFLKDIMKSTSRITSNDPSVQTGAVELGRAFPNVDPTYLVALVRLTHPSTDAARDLANALTKPRHDPSSTLPLIPQYAPPALSDEEYEIVGKKKPKAAVTPQSSSFDQHDDGAKYARETAAYGAARLQAHAAFRKSKSNGLYGGVAGYYSQVSREHAANAQRYSSAIADQLVDSQSAAGSIDLHGVNVQDALRISKQRVERWYSGLGENKVNGRAGAVDRATGFTIITGVGHHSEGGKGKLGPAVSKMLIAEGWRVEKNGGSITVRGRARA
ncbi:hypothetical protein MBLNU457_4559t1 [Dothideomycetes sp. NU457]